MGQKRMQEKNRELTEAVRRNEARVYTDAISGKRVVKKNAPNVDKKTVRRSVFGTRIFYNCPKCGKPLEFKKKMHQGLCMRCGQRLDWARYDSMPAIWLEVKDADEAAYWASQYETTCKTLYGIDFEAWRLSVTRADYPMLLYFPFEDDKAYGRFMRKASKEANVLREVSL